MLPPMRGGGVGGAHHRRRRRRRAADELRPKPGGDAARHLLALLGEQLVALGTVHAKVDARLSGVEGQLNGIAAALEQLAELDDARFS